MIQPRNGSILVRPIIAQDAQIGWTQLAPNDDGSVLWKDAANHNAFWETTYDSWEAFRSYFPVVEFDYLWADPVPFAEGLTEAGDTNKWGELWEGLDSPLFATFAAAYAYLATYGYTENQVEFGGPEGVADCGVSGERHLYNLRRWNNPTVLYRYEETDQEAAVVFSLVDAAGATIRSATLTAHFAMLMEHSLVFPDAAGNTICTVAGTASAFPGTSELLWGWDMSGTDYDGAYGSPGLGGVDGATYTAATDNNRSLRRRILSSSWSTSGTGKYHRFHGVKVQGAGVVSDTLNVTASVYIAPGVRVFT